MAIDPLALVQEMRPKPSPEASSFVPQHGAMRRRRDTPGIEGPDGVERSVSELSGMPGTANFRAGVGNPPCAQCNQDHNPIKERTGGYDHNYLHPDATGGAGMVVLSGGQAPDAVIPQTPSAGGSPVAAAGAVPGKRVSVFPGRGDDIFVLTVEQRLGDDWDDVEGGTWKLGSGAVRRIIPVLRALDVKIRDRTGGDLVALMTEPENDR